MNTQSKSQNELNRVLEKIREIVEKSADGDYIYRGEPECYSKVSSSLYREYPHVEGESFDVEGAQEAILEEAEAYTDKTDPIEILTELQHFGGKTNLIDFTEDYLIALFFACDGSHEQCGRIILLKKESENYEVKKPSKAVPRVEFQKSIFVQSAEGFIESDNEITIPVDLKLRILDYLRKYHRISAETIYNDLHGFIKRSAYTEFLKGLTSHHRADEAKTREEKHGHYDNAIKHYTEASKLLPKFSWGYNNRGIVYQNKGKIDLALKDFNMAIELNSDDAAAYNNRGRIYNDRGEFDKAMEDYNRAIELKPDFAEIYKVYNNRAKVYSNKGEVERVIKDYDKVIELKPDYTEAYNNRGVAYGKKGEFAHAIKDFNKAIELDPGYC